MFKSIYITLDYFMEITYRPYISIKCKQCKVIILYKIFSSNILIQSVHISLCNFVISVFWGKSIRYYCA